jgi:hypothetical protein
LRIFAGLECLHVVIYLRINETVESLSGNNWVFAEKLRCLSLRFREFILSVGQKIKLMGSGKFEINETSLSFNDFI